MNKILKAPFEKGEIAKKESELNAGGKDLLSDESFIQRNSEKRDTLDNPSEKTEDEAVVVQKPDLRRPQFRINEKGKKRVY